MYRIGRTRDNGPITRRYFQFFAEIPYTRTAITVAVDRRVMT